MFRHLVRNAVRRDFVIIIYAVQNPGFDNIGNNSFKSLVICRRRNPHNRIFLYRIIIRGISGSVRNIYGRIVRSVVNADRIVSVFIVNSAFIAVEHLHKIRIFSVYQRNIVIQIAVVVYKAHCIGVRNIRFGKVCRSAVQHKLQAVQTNAFSASVFALVQEGRSACGINHILRNFKHEILSVLYLGIYGFLNIIAVRLIIYPRTAA